MTLQSGVRFVPIGNLKRPILLQLLNYSVSDQNFDARDQSTIFESRDCDGVNVTKIIWLYRPDVIAKATTKGEAEHGRKCSFQGGGEADAAGLEDVSELVLVLVGANR